MVWLRRAIGKRCCDTRLEAFGIDILGRPVAGVAGKVASVDRDLPMGSTPRQQDYRRDCRFRAEFHGFTLHVEQ